MLFRYLIRPSCGDSYDGRKIEKTVKIIFYMISFLSISCLPARAQDIVGADLMRPGPLGDIWLGSSDAKITVIEYASMTCPHCAAFNNSNWKILEEKYINKGKIRFTLREFSLDKIAIAAFMIARCEKTENYYYTIDFMFREQANWVFVQEPQRPIEVLQQLLTKIGITKESFYECLANQKIYDGVKHSKIFSSKILNVSNTPTFFINGKKFVGNIKFEEFEYILNSTLAN